jgi:hypothetical protein
MSYLYMLSGIAFGAGPPVDGPMIRAWFRFTGHSRSGGLRRLRRRV